MRPWQRIGGHGEAKAEEIEHRYENIGRQKRIGIYNKSVQHICPAVIRKSILARICLWNNIASKTSLHRSSRVHHPSIHQLVPQNSFPPLLLIPALTIFTVSKPQRPLHLPHTPPDRLPRVRTHTHTQTRSLPQCRRRRRLRQASFLRVASRRPLPVLFPPDDEGADDVFQIDGDGGREALDDDLAVDLRVRRRLHRGADGMVRRQYGRGDGDEGPRRRRRRAVRDERSLLRIRRFESLWRWQWWWWWWWLGGFVRPRPCSGPGVAALDVSSQAVVPFHLLLEPALAFPLPREDGLVQRVRAVVSVGIRGVGWVLWGGSEGGVGVTLSPFDDGIFGV